MTSILRFLGNLYYRFFGSRRLSRLEQLCLDAWRASLSEPVKQVLDAQLQHLSFVQRQAGGAKLCFYYSRQNDFPSFNDPKPHIIAAEVELRDPQHSESRLAAKIYLHRGQFFSIEFPKRPARYLELHGMREDFVQVTNVLNKLSLA